MTNGATTTFTQGNTAAQICQEALAGNTLPTRWQSKCSPDVAALATMDCGKAHEALEADKAVVSLRRARRQERSGGHLQGDQQGVRRRKRCHRDGSEQGLGHLQVSLHDVISSWMLPITLLQKLNLF